MAYWITLRRANERLGFSTKTAEQALDAVERMRMDGWEDIRIIDPEGIETTARYLQIAIDSVDVEPV